MKGTLLFLVMAGVLTSAFAQNPHTPKRIQGIVVNADKQPMPGLPISLNWGGKPHLYKTDAKGRFDLKRLKLSRPFSISIAVKNNSPQTFSFKNMPVGRKLNLGVIKLDPGSELKQVVVEDGKWYVLWIDTVEYHASPYKVKPTATIEELLKKMNEFEVDTNGKVIHKGQPISKVSVNYKDNFVCDIIEKVDTGKLLKSKNIEDLIHRLPNFEVSADGTISVKEQSIPKTAFRNIQNYSSSFKIATPASGSAWFVEITLFTIMSPFPLFVPGVAFAEDCALLKLP